MHWPGSSPTTGTPSPASTTSTTPAARSGSWERRCAPVPEGGYQGDYIVDVAAAIPGAAEREVDDLAHEAVEILLAQIKATLERYGVRYDRFFLERSLHEGSPSALDRALSVLDEAGHI